jgi:hypothetical protein
MREPDSKVTVKRFLQQRKQWSKIVATDEGIQIDRSEAQNENADSPRTESREPGSNANVERFSQERKQLSGIASTDDKIGID